MKRKLVAAIACRNQGSRLYGKPLQNLNVGDGIKILDNILDCLDSISSISEIVLAIAHGEENLIYCDFAKARGIKWVIGDEVDVLGRLIACGESVEATDIFRVTSESPFPYYERVDEAWSRHLVESADGVFLDGVVDGCGFEIVSLSALQRSHEDGEDRHRSELCTLYIRENLKKFKILREEGPKELIRKDLRLTVDNPEDLIICRAVYAALGNQAPCIPIRDIVRYLDSRPDLIALTAPFAEAGYDTMYIWQDKL
jgi:spore coat polysaccharide biosynthesis protein SpsF